MTSTRSLFSLILALGCFAAAHSQSQNVDSTAVLHGVVKDASTGTLLSGVNVVSGSTHSATDILGRYAIAVLAGGRAIRFSYVGYKSFQKAVKVAAGDSVSVDVALIPSAVLLDEVTVTAERSPRTTVHGLGGYAMAPQRLQTIAGPFDDAYRLIQTMASVASNNEMSSQFNVRGGSFDENLVLLNGAQLLEPFHLKESPNTSVSIVNLDLLKKALFVPGGFTARYGDRLSAVLDMEYREGDRERRAAMIDASLVNAAATLESPFSSWGSGLISFRSTYSGYVSRYLTSGDKRNPSYYDVHAVVGGDIDDRHHLALQVLHSSDNTSGIANGSYNTTLVSLRSQQTISDNSILDAGVSLYTQNEDLTRQISSILDPLLSYEDINQWEANAHLDTRFSPSYSLRLGAGIQSFTYGVDRGDVVQGSVGDSSVSGSLHTSSAKISTYMENLVQVTDALLVNAGLRFDLAELTSELKVSPRLLAAYRLPSGTTLNAAWGVYYQTPNYLQFLAAARAGLPFQNMERAVHYVVGVEQPLKNHVSFRLAGYVKTLSDLISYSRERTGDVVYSPRNDAKGTVTGAELEMSITDERVLAWINVGLMRAREFNFFDGQGWRFRPTDQTKTVTTVFEYRIADRWLLNLRALYGSGFAYGNDLPGVEDSRLHYPDYKIADARISFSFNVGSAATTTYLEVMNLFAQRNVFSFTGKLQDPETPDFNLLLPTVVNVGIRVKI